MTPRKRALRSVVEGVDAEAFRDRARSLGVLGWVRPSGEVHANVLSLAMVEAAIRSAATGQRLTIARVLEDGYAAALRTETSPDVRDRLASWGGAAARLL